MGYSDVISSLRKQRGWTQADLAERVGVEQPSVQRWEKGTREPSYDKLEAIARALGVDITAFFSKDSLIPSGPTLYVKGIVAAGLWQEATEWPEDEWQSFTGRPDVTADISMRFGLRVEGESMNEIYPAGTIVECVSVFGHTEIVPGKRVVVIRKRSDLQFEATVKELRQDAEGNMWAIPRSTDPTFQPIKLNGPEPGILETRIAAVVVSSIRPE